MIVTARETMNIKAFSCFVTLKLSPIVSSQNGIKSYSITTKFLKMNILNQIVHGTREAPDLGEVDTIVRLSPTNELERATFGLG